MELFWQWKFCGKSLSFTIAKKKIEFYNDQWYSGLILDFILSKLEKIFGIELSKLSTDKSMKNDLKNLKAFFKEDLKIF